MSASTKQVYIPELHIKGSFIEELGSEVDKLIYPGGPFEMTLTAEDFDDQEAYHSTWIAVTKAVKNKLAKQ